MMHEATRRQGFRKASLRSGPLVRFLLTREVREITSEAAARLTTDKVNQIKFYKCGTLLYVVNK